MGVQAFKMGAGIGGIADAATYTLLRKLSDFYRNRRKIGMGRIVIN